MEKNEKIAFGVLFGLVFAQAVRYRRFHKKVVAFATDVQSFAQAVIQKEVDEQFNGIVNDTLRDM